MLLGAVVCGAREDYARPLYFRSRSGIGADPDVAWLLRRSLKTLHVRMERITAKPQEIARRLERVPGGRARPLSRVRWANFLRRRRRGGRGTTGRDVYGAHQERALSLGGVESVVETRSRWEGDRVPANLGRLSVGVEEVDDLWADLEQHSHGMRATPCFFSAEPRTLVPLRLDVARVAFVRERVENRRGFRAYQSSPRAKTGCCRTPVAAHGKQEEEDP